MTDLEKISEILNLDKEDLTNLKIGRYIEISFSKNGGIEEIHIS